MGVAQQFVQGVQFIRLLIINFFDAGIDQDFQAMNAWRMRDVNRRIFDRRSVLRRLRDSIHFSVDRAKAVLFGIAIGRL